MASRSESARPVLIVPPGFDFEYWDPKGYCPGISVRLPDGSVFPVFLMTRAGLIDELQGADPSAFSCFAKRGLIVVETLTHETVQIGIEAAWEDGFFHAPSAR